MKATIKSCEQDADDERDVRMNDERDDDERDVRMNDERDVRMNIDKVCVRVRVRCGLS